MIAEHPAEQKADKIDKSKDALGLYSDTSAVKLLYLFSHFSASLWETDFSVLPWKWEDGYRLGFVW